jgi:hypothetical protein
MSVQDLSRVFELSEATNRNRLVLLAIANYTDDDHEAWPSHATLARVTLLSVSSVKRAIGALCESGELEVVVHGAHKFQAANRKSNLYRIHLGRAALDPQEAAGGSEQAFGGSETASWGVTGELVTIIEPSLEPPLLELGEIQAETDAVKDEFERLWKRWPTKSNKIGSLKAYRKSRKDRGLTEAIAGAAVLGYVDSGIFERDGGKYAMMAATFFGPDERWRDWMDRKPKLVPGNPEVVSMSEAELDAMMEDER